MATLAAAALFLALGLGPALAQLSPAIGLPLARHDSELQRAAALTALGEGRTEAARYHARLSLAAMPWNQSSVTVIGQSLTGKPALAALNLSAALGWRDPLTNARLFDAAIAEKQPVIAAERVDALGRTVGFEVAGAMADRLLSVPGGTEALAQRAAYHVRLGDWIPQYLRLPPASAAVAESRAAFISRISTDDGPWRRNVLASAMSGLTQAKSREAALQLWRQNLADPKLDTDKIYDGKFSTLGLSGAIGSEWLSAPNPPARAERLSEGGLSITTITSEPGQVFGALVDLRALAPGFEAVWTGDESAVQSFSWQMNCGETGSVALKREISRSGNGWLDRYTLVGSLTCRVGYLELMLVRRPQMPLSVELMEIRSLAPRAAR